MNGATSESDDIIIEMDIMAISCIFTLIVKLGQVYKSFQWPRRILKLATKSVEGTTLTLEGVDNIHCGDSLALGVLGVGDGIPDHILEKHLQHVMESEQHNKNTISSIPLELP